MSTRGLAKTQRSKRALEDRAPKAVENVKKTLLLKGPNASGVVSNVLKDLAALKKPDSKMFTKRNMTRPFEDQSSVEFLCKANDSSLFAYGSHTKKRPHNLILGRTFDFQILDMLEMGIEPGSFKPMSSFEGTRKAIVRVGSKPMFVFQGSQFETNDDFGKFKSMILDYFRGEILDKINLAGVDRLIVCSAHKDKIYFRHYGVLLKNSGTKYPRVELELAGPSMDLKIRRVRSAPSDLQRLAMHKPRGQKSSKRKNMEKGQFGDKMARVHLGRQDFSEISLAKLKGLKKRKLNPEEQAAQAAAAEKAGTAEKGGTEEAAMDDSDE